VIEHLRQGKENAKTRQELCEITGLSDRQVRKLISEERKHGIPIVNDCDGKGYYIPTTTEEHDAYTKREKKRGFYISNTASKQELCLILNAKFGINITPEMLEEWKTV